MSATVYDRSSLIDGLSTTLLTLVANQPYLIRVVAHNNEGDSLPTESVFGYASDLPSTLTTPTVLDRKIDAITIGWNLPTSAIEILGYKLYINLGDNSYPSLVIYDGS